MKSINCFQTNSEIFRYLLDGFGSQSKIILVRHLIPKKPSKMISDLDVGVYGSRKKKTYHEFALLQDKVFLMSVYFYGYKPGEVVNPPKDIEVIKGEYNKNLNLDFPKEVYHEERIVTNFIFWYLKSL